MFIAIYVSPRHLPWLIGLAAMLLIGGIGVLAS